MVIMENIIQKAKELQTNCYNCKKCCLGQVDLIDGYNPHVFATGNLASPFMFIAEAPGKDETIKRMPLIGKSGKIYEEIILNGIGLKRDEVWTTNTVLCRPPNNRKPTPSERECCLDHLKQQFELIKPKLIITLGATPMSIMLGIESGITKMAGNKYHSDIYDIDVFVLLHPAYFLRNHNFDLLNDHVAKLKILIDKIINDI